MQSQGSISVTVARRAAAIAALSFISALGCSFEHSPPGAKVPVSFRAPPDPGSYKLSIVGSGRTEQTCDLPCTMDVPSGSAMLVGTGARAFSIAAEIPKEPAEAEFKLTRRRAQAIAGWVIALVGGSAGGLALGLTRNGDSGTQLKGGIAGASLAGVGLIGAIIALTAGSDEVKFTTGKAPGKLGGPAPPASPAPAGVCRSRFDCAGGKVCSLGLCVTPACVADSDCPKSQACSLEGQCESPGAAPNAAACRSHLECKNGLVCPKGQCVTPMCVADKDCPAGQGCSLEGQCEPAGRAR